MNWLKNKFQAVFKEKKKAERENVNPRMSDYPDFKVNDQIINYIQVQNTRLYFKAFDPQETVKTLQQQYESFLGKEMKLENEQVKISPDMPLHQILNSTKSRQVFQDIITKIEHEEFIQPKQIPEDKLEEFEKIVKKCNNFNGYDCTIHMKNGPGDYLPLGLKVTEKTTFNEVIKTMNEEPFNQVIFGEDIQFFNEAGKQFDEATYNTTFKDLQLHDANYGARYSYRNSLIRGDSMISVQYGEGKVPVSSLEIKGKKDILSFNTSRRKVQLNELTKIKVDNVSIFYRLTLSKKFKPSESDEPIVFEATGTVRVYVLTENFDYIWLPVQNLTKRHQVGGIKEVIYKIDSIEMIQLEEPEQFYGVEVLPAHSYVANSIIVHNSDSFTLKAYFLGSKQSKVDQITFYRHQQISKYFGNKTCEAGGLVLNNNHTFGDYQLEKLRALYVYEEKNIQAKQRIRTISQWNKGCFDESVKNQEMKELNKKLEEEYFGIYGQNVVSPTQIKRIREENQSGVVNILVALRMYFERIHYYMNVVPKYASLEQEAYNRYLFVEQKPKYKQIKNKEQNGKLSLRQITGIFLYTLEQPQVYRPINYYLRVDYPTTQETDVVKAKQFLPVASLIVKSLKKAPSFRGLVYRGVGKMDMKIALGLDKRKDIVASLNKGKGEEQKQIYKDKFIVFTSFTSTSTLKSVAQQFAQRCLLTIKCTNGYSIRAFSQFPHQQQVLLLPFTYFVINNYDIQSEMQTAEIEEIPMPKGTSDRIIFWVDDQPQNNIDLAEYFQEQGIEVVQVISTRIMKIILQNFFWVFKMLGKKVVIISDMVREQDGKMNYTAGVDLFEHIYNEYGLSNKAIIYAGNKKKAEDSLKNRNVKGNWIVITEEEDLKKQIQIQFDKM